jgi:uncharacterized membrane protein YvbJ
MEKAMSECPYCGQEALDPYNCAECYEHSVRRERSQQRRDLIADIIVVAAIFAMPIAFLYM